MKVVALMLVGIWSKKLLVAKAMVLAAIVKIPILMAPKRGVHLKKLPNMKDEK